MQPPTLRVVYQSVICKRSKCPRATRSNGVKTSAYHDWSPLVPSRGRRRRASKTAFPRRAWERVEKTSAYHDWSPLVPSRARRRGASNTAFPRRAWERVEKTSAYHDWSPLVPSRARRRGASKTAFPRRASERVETSLTVCSDEPTAHDDFAWGVAMRSRISQCISRCSTAITSTSTSRWSNPISVRDRNISLASQDGHCNPPRATARGLFPGPSRSRR